MIAVVETWRQGLWSRQHWMPNILSGVVVGIVALPLALAFAIASGARPEQGLYTAIVAGFLAALLGGSRYQVSGPTGAFIVILADITAHYGMNGLQVATLMAGVMLVLMGISRLGAILQFIPMPVIVGFTSGIAVIIWVGQWSDFFGLPAVSGEHFHNKLLNLIAVLPQFHWATTLLSILGVLILIVAARVPKLNKIPAPLTVLLVLTAIQSYYQFDGVATIGSAFGSIPQGLPSFELPKADLEMVMLLLGPAFTIAMLGSIESLLSAAVADGMTGTKHHSNQELIGQGMANIAAPLLGGFASTGAIARTATNINNGATGPLSAMVHALTLLAMVLIAAPLAEAIPLAALAAILFVVAYNMSEWRHFVHMVRKASIEDTAILLITFTLTILADLVIAVNVGVVLAALLFMRRMASSVEVASVTPESMHAALVSAGLPELPKGVQVYSIDGPLFFGAAENFQQALRVTQQTYHTLVLRLEAVPFVDITAVLVLEAVIQAQHQRGVRVILQGANAQVQAQLFKAGIGGAAQSVAFYATLQETMQALQVSAEY